MRAVLRSERARLTALYGALLVLAGGGLVALVNVLLREQLYARISGAVTTVMPGLPVDAGGHARPTPATPAPTPGGGMSFAPAEKLPPGATPSPELLDRWSTTRNLSTAVEQAAVRELTLVSLIALAVFAVVSVWLAWWMAGRVLRPVGVITETARRLSAANLHERIALKAPPGELKRLADTFDGMLDRMEDLVGAQRRFAANAAHELRTPLAVQRAAAEIGLAGEPDAAKVARIRERLIAVAESSEHLVESLLLLAVSEEGLESARPVDLAALVASEAAAFDSPADPDTPTVTTDLAPLTVRGDAALLGHLVRNLLDNAVRHNRPGGRVRVTTSADGELGELTVSNTGPRIDPREVPRLLEPFRRRAERRHTAGEGAGLGLSIVASIARAHGARLRAEAGPAPDGGLNIRLRFPLETGRIGANATSDTASGRSPGTKID
ncbi:ATP-binding protein [Streptomyces sp. RerS4]|uniref:ATP-binding protein n=1 Tax=Streptomyces sp. RerS4 TaxID=2942449 RepID=UPI00201B9A62|nr:ATP-binding protein [Streptomyces sp. RerS4]UQX02397.1 ATP-binding protein [Streptomyces sp. RerS4]